LAGSVNNVNLSPTQAIVLGLLELIGEGTPYDLKQAVGITVGHFWTFQHAQLYTETERMAKAGLLREVREEGGRRRKHYSLTNAGREALDQWRAQTHDEVPELRDLGMLKLFLGADPQALAEVQLKAHQRKLEEYYEIKKIDLGVEPRGPWIALEAGITYEKQMIRFWKQLADSEA
jgi:DNA-binding PadR family transcriptional regulator